MQTSSGSYSNTSSSVKKFEFKQHTYILLTSTNHLCDEYYAFSLITHFHFIALKDIKNFVINVISKITRCYKNSNIVTIATEQ